MSQSALRWRLAHGVEAAYSTAADGDARDQAMRAQWFAALDAPGTLATAGMAVPEQVHGAVIAVVDAAGRSRGCDGIATRRADLALGVFGADCPGLLLIAADAMAAAHCGWRGVAAGIVPRLVDTLKALSAQPPSAWSAFIGPGIAGDGEPRYEVDAPVLSARRWPAAALRPSRAEHAWLDVSGAIAADVAAAGVTSIQRCGICTHADKRLHSYRRSGAGTVQVLAAWRAAHR